jgi:hypothetical protein
MPILGDVGEVREVTESTHHLDRPLLRQSVESGFKLAASGRLALAAERQRELTDPLDGRE